MMKCTTTVSGSGYQVDTSENGDSWRMLKMWCGISLICGAASEPARPSWVVRRWSDDDQAMIGAGFLASQIIRCML